MVDQSAGKEAGEAHPPEIIIIRRGHGGDHDDAHGGVWKVAFADFMTAMMAFFLVLWIVNSTSKETRSSVARYFNPIQLANTTPARKGLRDPKDTDFDAAGSKTPEKSPGQSPDVKNPEADDPIEESTKTKAANKNKHPEPEKITAIVKPVPDLAIEQSPAVHKPVSSGNVARPRRQERAAYRDPFKPLQPVSVANTLAHAGQIGTSVIETKPREKSKNPASKQPGNVPEKRSGSHKSPAKKAVDHNQGLIGKYAKSIAAIRKIQKKQKQFERTPEIKIQATHNRILVSLIDRAKFSMFKVNSAKMNGQTRAVIRILSRELKKIPGQIVIHGHTDAYKFKDRRSNNYLLSASRANAALELMQASGMDVQRVAEIVGKADRQPKNTANRFAPENRRLDILIHLDRDRSK